MKQAEKLTAGGYIETAYTLPRLQAICMFSTPGGHPQTPLLD